MAEPISSYTPTPVRITPDADEELQRLLQTLHEKGVLRLANDAVAAGTPITRILMGGLDSQGARNAVQNLAALMIVLGRLEPATFYKGLTAVENAIRQLGAAPVKKDEEAPGLKGVYRMLNDKDLWQNARPVLDAIKAFVDTLDRDVEKPVTDMTGKRGGA